jgi:hypothetical protein
VASNSYYVKLVVLYSSVGLLRISSFIYFSREDVTCFLSVFRLDVSVRSET